MKDGLLVITLLGRSFLITSQRSLNQCLESLVQKIQHGVVVNLEKVMTEGTMTD